LEAEITREKAGWLLRLKSAESSRQTLMEKFKKGSYITRHFSESQTYIRETERSHKFLENSWKELAGRAAVQENSYE
jgi:hypothetical protein